MATVWALANSGTARPSRKTKQTVAVFAVGPAGTGSRFCRYMNIQHNVAVIQNMLNFYPFWLTVLIMMQALNISTNLTRSFALGPTWAQPPDLQTLATEPGVGTQIFKEKSVSK